ncbi:hypothetical protein DL240_13715 [Lujinxingia litoralis]|uniref:Uncharacterized protein n=1 Tax=Lujinxingia litoralis TaxID=2211119 RepID=A0A328C7S6_9DELT|nr:hypothetical protein [Lujinxingia litoralis]RAL21185.1 hypothetical protein DL240_13715 [Lujinxingia litoralis]
MSERLYLQTYLRDHYAAATGGLELARRIARENSANPIGHTMAEIAEAIEDEVTLLRAILKELEISPSRLKGAGVWMAEKMGRLKLNNEVVRYSHLSRLVELEGALSGVQAKEALWRTLLLAREHHPELEKFDLEALLEQAGLQRRRLRELHHDAALIVLRKDRTHPHPEFDERPPAS